VCDTSLLKLHITTSLLTLKGFLKE